MDWEPCGSGRVSGTYNHTTVLTHSHLSKALHTSIFFCCSDIRWWLGEGRRPTKSFCEQNLYSMSSTIECVGREGVWSHGGRKGCGPMVEGRGVVPWWKEGTWSHGGRKGCGPMVEGRGVVPWWDGVHMSGQPLNLLVTLTTTWSVVLKPLGH